MRLRVRAVAAVACVLVSGTAAAQSTPSDPPSPWNVSADGVVFATVDRQTGPRGATQVVSQNWAMLMGMRPLGGGMLTLAGMLSAEPLTVGLAGYPEIFQEGEAYHGLQVTDHQHPHDLLMQLSAAWRLPLGDRAGFTVAGGPVGEAALGPVAFMHRPSAAENPTAPLSHHIFDSTHIVTGVAMIGFDRGPIAIEGSIFRGREPDEDRYDVDFGALDSWSTRVWLRPGSEWTMQASYGFLHEPEQLEPGDQRRANASASWLRQRDSGYTAVTAAFGQDAREFSTVHATLLELTHQTGGTSIYSRFENLTVETEILLIPQIVHRPHPGEFVDPITAITGGVVRDLAAIRGFTVGIGGDLTAYRVPDLLQFTHGEHPMSFHVFLRVRPPAIGGRMWNMTMGQTMSGDEHGHHGM
jgi:hypothetical protein